MTNGRYAIHWYSCGASNGVAVRQACTLQSSSDKKTPYEIEAFAGMYQYGICITRTGVTNCMLLKRKIYRHSALECGGRVQGRKKHIMRVQNVADAIAMGQKMKNCLVLEVHIV